MKRAKGVINTDPSNLLKAYLLYVESLCEYSSRKNGVLVSIILHEVITDIGLVFDMEWLFKAHIELLNKRGIKPGFDTHNFPLLVEKFVKWGIDLRKITITTQFNSIGFGMCPSKEKYEEVLKKFPDSEVIAYGILASGYLKLPEAVEYIKKLPDLKGLAIGVSNENHSRESFKFIKERLSSR